MLVVLDTTAIMSDPMCTGVAWRILANARSIWDVHVYVPEVVVIEAVAGYQRRLSEAMVGWDRWEEKHGRPLGLTDAMKGAKAALNDAASSYPARLRTSLDELAATVLAPPSVDHAVIAQRAANRQRPCNDNGDGYRDTLNWLTVLSLASQYPDAQIVWVSDNSGDFGKKDSCELHEQLADELIAAKAEKRVRWIRTLPDLVLSLAGEQASEIPSDLKAIQARLRDEALGAFISADVLAKTRGNQIDSRRCGLPTVTLSARIVAAGELENLNLTVRGAATNNETIVEFELEANTLIQIELPPGISDLSTVVVSIDSAGSTAQLMKKLKFRGLITLDKYDRPIDAELTRITAKDDDPGLPQWAALSDSPPVVGGFTFADVSSAFAGFKLADVSPIVAGFTFADVSPAFAGFKLADVSPTVAGFTFADASSAFAGFKLADVSPIVAGFTFADIYPAMGTVKFDELREAMGTVSFGDLNKMDRSTTTSKSLPTAENIEPATSDSTDEESKGEENE